MGLLTRIRRSLAEPRLRGVDIDSDELIAVHREILEQKPMLNDVFREIYKLCRDADERHFGGEGLRIEIGSGSSLFTRLYPDVLSSDVKRSEHLDLELDVQGMKLDAASVRAFYGVHCFHHLPQPAKFFAELERVLVPGGGCVLVEPYYGPLAAAFYRRVFDTEHFDPNQEAWEIDPSTVGAMSNANQALSYIVFERDADRFQREHPVLEIVSRARLPNFARYLLSGGLNFKQLVPSILAPAIKAAERIASPIDHLFALHHAIVLRKRAPEVRP